MTTHIELAAEGTPEVILDDDGALVILIPLNDRPDDLWAYFFRRAELPWDLAEVVEDRGVTDESGGLYLELKPETQEQVIVRLLDWLPEAIRNTNSVCHHLEMHRVRAEKHVTAWWHTPQPPRR